MGCASGTGDDFAAGITEGVIDMERTTKSGQTGEVTPMTWGEYRASLTDDQRAVLRDDPLNRDPQVAAQDTLRTGKTADQMEGYFFTPDGTNPYQDPTPRWLDTTTFARLF